MPHAPTRSASCTRSCPRKRSMPRSTRSSPRSSRTARPPCARARSSCRTSRTGLSTTRCAPIPHDVSPTSARAPKARRACRRSSTSASRPGSVGMNPAAGNPDPRRPSCANCAALAIAAAPLVLAACAVQPAAEPLAPSLREEVITLSLPERPDLTLETTLFKPPGDGPFPLVIINHGKSPGDLGWPRAFCSRGCRVRQPRAMRWRRRCAAASPTPAAARCSAAATSSTTASRRPTTSRSR